MASDFQVAGRLVRLQFKDDVLVLQRADGCTCLCEGALHKGAIPFAENRIGALGERGHPEKQT